MAITLYNTGFGTVDTKSLAMLYDKTFDKIKDLNDKALKEGIKFVAERDAVQESYIEGEVTNELGLPFVSNDTEKIRMLSPMFGHDVTITMVQYRAGIAATRRAEKSQKTRMLKRLMTGLPASADRKVEYLIADLFNSGFTTTTGGDGSFLYSADHTKFDASVAAWTNLMTASDFTTGSYFLMWQNAQNRTSERGFPDPHKITELIYPVGKHRVVAEVLGSPKVAENALNNINAFQGDCKATCYHYLTSTTAHFARLDYGENEGFVLVWWDRPDYASISVSDNPEIIWGKRVLLACAAGAIHARNWIGNAGA